MLEMLPLCSWKITNIVFSSLKRMISLSLPEFCYQENQLGLHIKIMSPSLYRCKYLYLLFDDTFLVGQNYIFTTEGHPLPVLSSWHERLPEAYGLTNGTSIKVFLPLSSLDIYLPLHDREPLFKICPSRLGKFNEEQI